MNIPAKNLMARRIEKAKTLMNQEYSLGEISGFRSGMNMPTWNCRPLQAIKLHPVSGQGADQNTCILKSGHITGIITG